VRCGKAVSQLSALLMPDPGNGVSSRLGKSRYFPRLKGIDELLKQTFIILMHVLAHLTDNGKRLKLFVIVPHEFKNLHPVGGKIALIYVFNSLCQGTGNFLISIIYFKR
jgi:hypothetical protein